MNPTSKKISSLSDKRFLKLLGNVKAELQERAQREPQTKKTAQKTGQLNDLSEKGLQVLLVDLIAEVEKRFFVPADSDSDVPPVSKDRVRVSQLDMAQQRLTRLDLGIVTANTDAQVANTTKSNTIPSAKSESCKMDELTPPLSSKSRFPAESTQIESVTENGAERVIKVADICKASLGYLVKCYKAPITASPGIIIKQMKESVSLLRDLSKVTEEFMESLLLLSKLENEHDNLIVFLDCVLEFLGSSVKVIMAKFNPAITPAASEVQAIKLEINKVLFMMNALQVSLSTSPDLEISTLQEECPSIDLSNSQSTTTILDFHTNFQEFLHTPFKTHLVSVLTRPSSSSQITTMHHLVKLLATQLANLFPTINPKNEDGTRTVNEALQSLVAVCRGLNVIMTHDDIVEVLESVFEVDRGVSVMLEEFKTQMPF